MRRKKGVRGRIDLKPVEFSEIIEVEVKKANDTSGRIYLPSRFIGKKVYVLINDDKNNHKKVRR